MSFFKDTGFIALFFILNFVSLVVILVLAHTKNKHFDGNSSVVNQEFDFDFDNNLKNNYNLLKDGKLNDMVIDGYLQRYGIDSQYIEFSLYKDTLSEINGNNLVNFIKGERDNQNKCVLFAYNRDNIYETTIFFSLVNYFKNTDYPFGLSLLAVGYNDKFKKYSIGVKEYLKTMFSENNPFPECYFIGDGLSIDINESLKNNFILISNFGMNSNFFQKNYNEIILKTARDIKDVKVYLVDPNQKYEYLITKYFNYYFMNPLGFNMDYSLVFTSIKKQIFSNPHENHNWFLTYGINSFTNKLYINPKGNIITTWSNFIKITVKHYNIANSNDYTTLDTNYIYLIHDFDFSILKDKIIISAIVSFIIYLFINFAYVISFRKLDNFINNLCFNILLISKNFLFLIFINKSHIYYNKYSKYIYLYNNNFNTNLCSLDQENYDRNIINYYYFLFNVFIFFEMIFIILHKVFFRFKNLVHNKGYATIASKLVMDSVMLMISIHNIGYNVFTIFINFALIPFVFLRNRYLKLVLLFSILIYIYLYKYEIFLNYYEYLLKLPRIKSCNEINKLIDFNYYNWFSVISILWSSFYYN